MFGFGKLFAAFGRRARQADNEAAMAIDVADAEKGRQVIEDATAQVRSFESQVAKLMASKKGKQSQVAPLESTVTKFDQIARKAGEAGSVDDVRAAVNEKIKFQAQLDTLKSEIAKDTALETKLRAQLSAAQEKISNSNSKASSLRVRQESAHLRQALAANSIDSKANALGQLDEWEQKVNQQEALAEAQEELAGSGTVVQTLEERYGGNAAAVDAEMAKYLKPASNS